jgi:hypothetical protein
MEVGSAVDFAVAALPAGALFLLLALAVSFFFAAAGFADFFVLLFVALAFFMPRNLP